MGIPRLTVIFRRPNSPALMAHKQRLGHASWAQSPQDRQATRDAWRSPSLSFCSTSPKWSGGPVRPPAAQQLVASLDSGVYNTIAHAKAARFWALRVAVILYTAVHYCVHVRIAGTRAYQPTDKQAHPCCLDSERPRSVHGGRLPSVVGSVVVRDRRRGECKYKQRQRQRDAQAKRGGHDLSTQRRYL